MSNVIYNPESLNGHLVIKEDSTIKYFLTKGVSSPAQELFFEVEENTNLDLIIVDFAIKDIELSIKVDLKHNASANLYLASLDGNECKKIFHFDVNHLSSDTTSQVIMSGINSGKGVLRFLGNSFIKNGSHRSKTRQEGRITNLSSECKSEASPSLLIKENDVVASHGAALGAYNPEQLYYLMSRGLTMQESKKLITYGTLLPIIEKLDDEEYFNQAKKSLEELSL